MNVIRMERNAVAVHALGPRVFMEFLLAIGRKQDCLPEIEDQLESYATELTLEMVRAAGADRMVNRRPHLVSA